MEPKYLLKKIRMSVSYHEFILTAPRVGLEPTTTRLTAECSAIELLRIIESGDDLSYRAVASQVLSAREVLTSVFGMGTGGTPQPLSPENLCHCH